MPLLVASFWSIRLRSTHSFLSHISTSSSCVLLFLLPVMVLLLLSQRHRIFLVFLPSPISSFEVVGLDPTKQLGGEICQDQCGRCTSPSTHYQRRDCSSKSKIGPALALRTEERIGLESPLEKSRARPVRSCGHDKFVTVPSISWC